jgi:hypothetical protein
MGELGINLAPGYGLFSHPRGITETSDGFNFSELGETRWSNPSIRRRKLYNGPKIIRYCTTSAVEIASQNNLLTIYFAAVSCTEQTEIEAHFYHTTQNVS